MKLQLNFWLVMLFSLIFINVSSQNLYLKNIKLSQNSNHYIYQATNNTVFIGSIDGLNIFDGRKNKIYRPSMYNMIGNNIQSDFFEDDSSHIWFSTYKALHEYIESNDDFNYYQFNDEGGKIIEADYRVIHKKKDTLWVQAENFTFLFDTKSKSVIKRVKSNSPDYSTFKIHKTNAGYQLICGGGEGLKIINMSKKFTVTDTFVDKNFSIYSIELMSDCLLAIGTFDGQLIHYNICTKTPLSNNKITNVGISKIQKFSDTTILMSIDDIYLFDINKNMVIKRIVTIDNYSSKSHAINTFHLGIDSTLWFSIEGKGCFNKKINKQKFSSDFKQETEGYSITRIEKIGNKGMIFIAKRKNDFSIFDTNGKLIKEVKSIQGRNNFSIHASLRLQNGDILFESIFGFYLISGMDYKLTKLNNESKNNKPIFQIIKANSDYYCLMSNGEIHSLTLSKNSFNIKSISINEITKGKITTNIISYKNDIFLSSNDEKIISISKQGNDITKNKEYSISGQIKCITDSETKDSFYIGTVNGLYKCSSLNNGYRKLLDKNKLLSQTIYSIFKDKINNLWLSSNSGILKLNPKTLSIHQFKKKDGIQAEEFNSNAFLKLSENHILMGGLNGVNSFDPNKITLSDYQPLVYISSVLVNDEPYKIINSNSINIIKLPYSENTISFTFHSTDYSDIESTKCKYKLIGKDKNWVISSSVDGSARYSNLSPKKYQLSILGSNSDGIWNNKPRNISITILPAWYQTWWFKVIALMGVIGSVYYLFRLYHKRKIREKDFQLREQKMLLEKQLALEAERTRIAGEMHDDLGGGLTTIKFLSQKILRKVEDKNHKSQIQKIVNHTQNLVTNMSEIIWAMNSGFDTLDSLIAYTRRYANEYLLEHELKLYFKINGNTKGIKLSGEKRRHLFLIIKESLHNVVKHADASNVEINFEVNDNLNIIIKDNGKGINNENLLGNGLKNMKNRIEKINSKIEFINNNGTSIKLSIPVITN